MIFRNGSTRTFLIIRRQFGFTGETIMHTLIFLFSVFLIAMGAIILMKPSAVFDLLERHKRAPTLQMIAVVVRVLLGVALIVAAPASKFPLTLAVIGWVAVFAGVLVAAMGRSRFIQLMEWVTKVLPKNAILMGVIAIMLGSFLAYAIR
jgi:hypothetical protein